MSVASRRLIGRASTGCYGSICQKIPKQHHLIRGFWASPQRATDGVYKELTEMRIRTPWIEALKKKQEEEQDPSMISKPPATLPDRDLRPKKMSDSFTRIVRMMRSLVFTSQSYRSFTDIYIAVNGTPACCLQCRSKCCKARLRQ